MGGTMEFQALGPVSHRTPSGWVSPSGRLQRTLLACLLARVGEVIPADELIDGLWGAEADSDSLGRLQVHVHRLRRALADPSRLEGTRGGYVLRAETDEVDVLRFESLTARALEADTGPAEVEELVDAALALWSGRPFDGVSSPACESEAARLEGRRVAALEVRYAAALTLGRHGEVLDDLNDLARRHPLNEDLQALLMTALDRAGRRGDALSAFRRTRTQLVDELGVEPGPRLQRLHEQVLLGEGLAPEATGLPVPRQLPPAPRLLAGRDGALDQLDALLLTPTPSVAVLVGTPGVGKTTLALAWAHRHRDRYPDGQLHCDLRGFGSDRPMDPSDVLDTFARALGVTSLPSTLEERSALFRSHLSGRRMLVLLDNAGSEEQVRPLLPATPGCDVLVTSRLSLSGLAVREDAQLMWLAPLDGDVATALMADALGPRLHDEPEATRELIAQCAGLPLALRIVAQQLRARPSMSIAAFAEEITQATAPLDRFDLGEASTSVRAVLGWSYDSLDDRSRRALRALGLFAGRRADVHVVAAMAGWEPPVARAALDQLDRANLIEEEPAGVYHLHDLLRTFAGERARAEEPADEQERMRNRLLAHYVAGAITAGPLAHRDEQTWPQHAREVAAEVGAPDLRTGSEARAWFAAHDLDLIACAAEHDALSTPGPEGDALVRDLAPSCSGHLLASGVMSQAVPLLKAWRHAARRAEDVREEARASVLVGSARRDAGQAQDGERELRAAMALAIEHGHEDIAAKAMLNLGVAILSTDRAHEVHDLYRTALEIDERLGLEAHAHLVRINLGTTLILLGRLDEAIAVAEEAVDASRATGDDYNLAFSTQLIGEVLLRQGKPEQALEHAERALSYAREINATAREADITHLVGAIMMALGKHQAALDEFQAGLRQSRELENIPIVLETMVGCADALFALGSPEALSYLHEARALAHASGDTRLEAELLRRLDDDGADLTA